jgi:hypothetical protein
MVLIAARTYNSIATISQSHGLSDISASTSRIDELTVKVLKKGVFQEFSAVVSEMGCITYYDNSMLSRIHKPFDHPRQVSGKTITLRQIITRVPGLDESFERTFNEKAGSFIIDLYNSYGHVELKLWDVHLFTTKAELIELIETRRSMFPFLNTWCFSEANHAWNKSVISLRNITKPDIGEFSDPIMIQAGSSFIIPPEFRTSTVIPFDSIMPPLAGGITDTHLFAMQPYDGVLLSEFSLHFMGCFLLSSLVRYRPQIWQRALSHSGSANVAADDKSLALIEQFCDVVISSFRALVVHSMGLKSV